MKNNKRCLVCDGIVRKVEIAMAKKVISTEKYTYSSAVFGECENCGFVYPYDFENDTIDVSEDVTDAREDIIYELNIFKKDMP